MHADVLRTYIEHAPKDPGTIAEDLRGWTMPDTDEFVCATCAGRIMARGCRLPASAEPNWLDQPRPETACVCCQKPPEATP